MPRVFAGLVVLVLGALGSPTPVQAQDATAPPPLRVFLQCAACNADAVRTEISYVEWAAGQADADLHVVSREVTAGNGGRAYQLDFTGLGGQEGRADTLTYIVRGQETPEATGQGLRRILTLGLMRYLANTPLSSRIQIRLPAPPPGTAATRAAVRDPWNFWTFTVGGGGSVSGESSRSTRNVNARFSGNRTTDEWKLTFSGQGNRSRRSISYKIAGRDTTSITTTESTFGSVLVARSLSGHATLGLRGNMNTSTVNNTKLSASLTPTVEYDLYPYSESTRRSLALNYSAGLTTQKYREETIYFQTAETRPIHSLSLSYSTSAPWGNAYSTLSGSQYLHDTDLYSASVSGSFNANITRGLQFNVFGQYSHIRNQISLPRREATQEEVLLQQRALATGFSYFTQVGLSYRFGSSVQNVVNPRFSPSQGGTVFID